MFSALLMVQQIKYAKEYDKFLFLNILENGCYGLNCVPPVIIS